METVNVRISVPITREELAALVILARQEKRDGRNQAAIIIRRELERSGLLPKKPVAGVEK